MKHTFWTPVFHKKNYGIYIHIPFCIQKCHYCSFNSFATQSIPEDQLLDQLLNDLNHHLKYVKDKDLKTCYIGGGTPNILSTGFYNTLLDRIYQIDSPDEITIELNPELITPEQVKAYRALGINRFSIGAQTFHPDLLKKINRKHTPDQVFQAAKYLSGANISLDLIFALPGQTLEMLKYDLEQLLAINPSHLSIYNLNYEPGSRFYKQLQQKKIAPISEELELEMYQLILKELSQNGFNRYEVSNFARDNMYSRHNTLYWENTPYLGIGPGAHSYYSDGTQLIRSIKQPRWKTYLSSPPEQLESREILSLSDYIFDCTHTMLRQGAINFDIFYSETGIKIETLINNGILKSIPDHLYSVTDRRLILTEEGWLNSDTILSCFYSEILSIFS